jgi:sugar lactone lactonase YvrE
MASGFQWRLVLGIALALATAPSLHAASGDAVADRVLGQVDFTSSGPNLIDGRGFVRPWALAIDSSSVPNRLYVADKFNNRVLGWRDAAGFRLGRAADLVIGQPDFASTNCNAYNLGPRGLCLFEGFDTGVAVDRAGNVYVSDGGNRRVLEYDSPYTTDTVADRVFGQADFVSRQRNCTDPEGFCLPGQLAVDGAGHLFVADFGRVLEYDHPLAGEIGAAVSDHRYGATAPDGTCAPTDACPVWIGGVAVDPAGNLFVSDFFQQWVVVYLAPATTDNVPDRLIGRDRFDAPVRLCNEPLASATTLCQPRQIAIDGAGSLYVADNRNFRVLVFEAPLAIDGSAGIADHVLGQPDGSFTTAENSCFGGTGPARRFCFPQAVAVDGAGNVYVADSSNDRVLRYDRPFAAGAAAPVADPIAAGVLGQVDRFHTTENRVDARGLAYPSALAIDRSVRPNRLYVLDSNNSRVLGWRDAQGFRSGAPADLVLGQPDPFTAGCNTGGVSAASLCLSQSPSTARDGLAVDAHGNLFVADGLNSRVLEYDAPFATDTIADRVYGQPDFTVHGCNGGGLGQGSLCGPSALAVDAGENLFIADAGNNRVLVYRDALADTRFADRVLGQQGSFRTAHCATRATAANFCFPTGLALDRRGDLFVADGARERILRFHDPLAGDDVADQVIGQRGRFDTAGCETPRFRDASLCGLEGIAFDDQGRLLAAAANRGQVIRFRDVDRGPRVDRTLGILPFAPRGTTAETLIEPHDVAVDDDGNVYVADAGNHRVLAFDRP